MDDTQMDPMMDPIAEETDETAFEDEEVAEVSEDDSSEEEME